MNIDKYQTDYNYCYWLYTQYSSLLTAVVVEHIPNFLLHAFLLMWHGYLFDYIGGSDSLHSRCRFMNHSGRCRRQPLYVSHLLEFLLYDYRGLLGYHMSWLSWLLDYICMHLMNDWTIDLMDDVSVHLMYHWLMNLADLFLVNDRLMMFMNDRLVMFMDHILMMFVNHLLMVLMDHVSVRFLNYWSVHFLYDLRRNSVWLNQWRLAVSL